MSFITDNDVQAAVQRGIEVITTYQNESGAYPACEEFSAYRGYCWLRDGSFIADAMSRQGAVVSATNFHDWCNRAMANLKGQVTELLVKARSGVKPAQSDMLPTRFTFDGEIGGDPWWDFQLDGYGTWLWAVHTHAARHNLPLEQWKIGIQVAAEYLLEFWDTPCYDWWEEHDECQHNSTLGAIYAGLKACAASAVLAPELRSRADTTADTIRNTILTRGVASGNYISKWIGTEAVDASTLSCIVPFGVLALDDQLAGATLERIEQELCVNNGTHRFAADVFYGGGQWPLLSCFLGWNHARAGRRDRARELLNWAISQADENGFVPEQVDQQLLHPAQQAEWIAKWGAVAKPLLWSHAMILTLASELGITAGKNNNQ
ncbi:MAG: glycoside hydrolase family 15 [Propionibacteriaceae bacterium]|jgi:GH15 family glucan-1,4-alpha-glucosidase|nr:glycoside hydrolase family 15 [Propionibacteriaceae bacterium]